MRNHSLSTPITTHGLLPATRRARLCTACLLAVLLCASLLAAPRGLAAGRAAPYGERLVRVGEAWADGKVAVREAPEAPEPTAGDAYLEALEQAQQEGGPYAAGLEEPLAGLARWYWSQGDLAAAESTLSRALHVLRINEGLRSERQTRMLDDLIALSRTTGNLSALDDRYDYLYFLSGSGRPPYSEDRLAVIHQYLRWQREAYRLGLDGSAGRRRLMNAAEVNEDVLRASGSMDAARRWQLVQSQLWNFYLLQSALGPRLDALRAVPAGFGGGYRYPDNEMELERQRLEQQWRGGLARGRELLDGFLASLPGDDPLREEVRLALADWYQWHGSTRRALEIYGGLADALLAAGERERYEGWFAEPTELPADGALWQAPAPGAEPEAVIELQFDLTADGRVREVQALRVPEGQRDTASRMRRELYAVRFRPAFEAGDPVARGDLVRAYQWLPLRRSR